MVEWSVNRPSGTPDRRVSLWGSVSNALVAEAHCRSERPRREEREVPQMRWDYQFPRGPRSFGQSQPGRRAPGNRVRVALAGLRDGAYRSACALRPYLWTGAAALAVLCVLALVLRFGIGRHSDVEPAQVAGDGELTRLESQLSELKQQLADQKAASEASKPVAAVAGNWLRRDLGYRGTEPCRDGASQPCRSLWRPTSATADRPGSSRPDRAG